MSTTLDQFISTMTQRQQQLQDVVDAYRVFRQKLAALPSDDRREAYRILNIEEEESGFSSSDVYRPSVQHSQDLADKTSEQCAVAILNGRNNEPTHFSIIAKEAIARGYKGRRGGTPEEIESRISQSFWAMLSRNPDVFESLRKGRYRLKTNP